MRAVPHATRPPERSSPPGYGARVGERLRGGLWVWVRLGLVVFVLAWILGPSGLRDRVPILLVFALALGLELQFLVGALRGGPGHPPDRRPQPIDTERYGFPEEDEADLDDDAELDGGAEDEGEEDIAYPATSPLRRFAIGVALVAALGALVWFANSRTGWRALSGDTKAAAVARFSSEASRIAGKPVSVRCDEARDYVGAVQHADGVAIVGGDLAIVTPEICRSLYDLAFRGENHGSRTGRAVAVLAHEAWHLRGEHDEGTTECYALQSGVELGRRLGLSRGAARQLMRQQLTENALRGVDTLEYRLPADCRDGGRLDLRPADSRFP